MQKAVKVLMQTSPHNKEEDGYILMDLLVAILIISVGFISVFRSLSVGIMSVAKIESRVIRYLEQENEHEQKIQEYFTTDKESF